MQEAAGIARPVDTIDGSRNLNDCFTAMLQEFDEPCRMGLYTYFGYATMASRGNELGLKNTVFAGEDTITSANDVQGVLLGLYRNQIARAQGGQNILSVGRTIRDNDGIPAGVTSGQAAHYIGENDVMHNDAGVIYGNHGAYALTILSKDAGSWDKVAELARKIEALKAVKVPTDAR